MSTGAERSLQCVLRGVLVALVLLCAPLAAAEKRGSRPDQPAAPATSASAAGQRPSREQCAALHGLTVLDATTRKALVAGCEAPTLELEKYLPAVVRNDPWAVPLVVTLALETRQALGFPSSSPFDIDQGVINQLVARHATGQCKDSFENVTNEVGAFLVEKETGRPMEYSRLADTSLRELLGYPSFDACFAAVGEKVPSKARQGFAERLAGQTILAVLGYPGEELCVLSEGPGASAAPRAEAEGVRLWPRIVVPEAKTSAPNAQTPDPGAFIVRGRVLHFVVVPRGEPTWLIVRGVHRGTIPQARRVIADRDQVVDLVDRPRARISFEVKPDKNVSVYVDGFPVEKKTQIDLLAERHEIRVIDRDDAPPSVVIHTQEDLQPLRDGPPKLFKYDVSRSRQLAVLPLRVSERCRSVGISSAPIERRLTEFLRDMGQAHSDLGLAAQFSQKFQESLDSLSALPSARSGPQRGDRDASFEVSQIAKDFFNRGYGRLLWVDVECAEQRDTGRQIAISASVMDLTEFDRQRGMRGDSDRMEDGSEPAEQVLRRAVRVVSGNGNLRDGLAMPVAEALGLPSARLTTEPKLDQYLRTATVELEATLGDQPHAHRARLVWHAAPLPQNSASEICRQVESINSLKIDRSEGDVIRLAARERRDDELEIVERSGSVVRDAKLQLKSGATHLTWLTLDDGDGRLGAHGLACVFPEESGSWLWGAYSEDLGRIWTRLEDSRPEQYTFRSFLVGVTPSARYEWLGATAGYAVTRRRGTMAPSWSDLGGALDYDAQGKTPYTVIRRSLLAGVTVVWEPRISHYVTAFTRASVLGNFGFLELAGVPAGLKSFRDSGSDSAFDFDVAAIVQAGISWQIHPSFTIEAFVHASVPEAIDATRGLATQEPQLLHIGYDGNVVAGAGVGFRVMR